MTITVFDESFSVAASTITMPASVQAGDRAYLFDVSTNSPIPASVTPSGWTLDTSVVGGDTVTRFNISHKDLAGTEGGSTITCMNGPLFSLKGIIVVRKTSGTFGNTQSLTADVNVVSGGVTSKTSNAGSGASPLIVLGWGIDNAHLPAAAMSPAATGSVNAGTTSGATLVWKIYDPTTSANVTVSDPSGTGTCVAMAALYFENPTNFAVAVGESISIADSQTAVFGIAKSISESVSIADSQTSLAAFFKSVAETASIADSQTGVANFPKSVAESIAIADSQTSVANFPRSVAESISIADTPSETAAFLASVAEGFGIADTVSAGGDFGETVAETIAISDAFTAVFDGGQTSRGGISWKPEKDYQWPDLKSEIRQAVEDIARRSSQPPEAEQIVPEVVEAVRATVPSLPSINLQQLIFEITSAILDVQMAEDEEAAAMLLLCE